MFFYSPNVAASSTSSTSHRRQTLTHQHHLHVGHLDTRLSVQIPEILSRSLGHDSDRARLVPEHLRFLVDDHQELWTGSQPAGDHVTARWEGANINSQSALLDADDGATVITDTIKDDQEDKEPKSCPQQTVKYIKILTPHVILVSVLIGYLCLGAWILMLLETRTELLARSKKLVRLTNLMSNFTAESWRMLSDAQHGSSSMDEGEWAATFREWMVRVSETVDDRRPIRRELNRPDDLSNMHNKWTFPTALLYVLTVLTTCGYGEVSVDTDVGKVFSVAFALVGIPLMFITAADIGKFLSETLLKFVSFWNRSVRKVKQWMSRVRHGRRKSLQSTGGQNDTLDILGVDGTEEKLWFPIGAYVSCICLYCSMGSAMFINWERTWSFIHAFHFGFNLIVTVGLGDIVVTDYIFLSLIVAFVIVGLSVVTMCVDLASTHLKAYFTRIHYFGRAKRFLGMSEELKEIVALLGAMRRKKGGKVTWNDVRDFLDNELRDRPFEPHELLMKLRFIDETSSGMSTIRHNSFQSDFFRESEYIRRVAALRPEQPAYL
uniref:Uncoordinated protein 58 n=1 Tax=Caenorhabditis tropicalis TaxID=1561998 RepID=A0A1I7U0M6_9PELO